MDLLLHFPMIKHKCNCVLEDRQIKQHTKTKKEVSHLNVTDSRVYLCLHRCIPKDRNPLGQPFLKSTPHFYFCEHQAQLRAIPPRFGEHHDALFLDSHQVQLAPRSNLMMSKLLSWQLRADLLLVACFLHLTFSAASLKAV